MTPGMSIQVVNRYGEMLITAGEGTKRLYSWDGETRWARHDPRGRRWKNGSLGLYFPGLGNHWKENKGIARGVLEEGQMHFETQAEAILWFHALPDYGISHVSRSDGVVR